MNLTSDRFEDLLAPSKQKNLIFARFFPIYRPSQTSNFSRR
ncbi:hypothetical protein VL20_282 [Microcystis panniformis FACHB-1757]|uniref:Uncharacterized protein n=1 Tax=Microcystis panniformis FACHB-1757 TaxID=1638788 RepID=A0A0K1RUR2_9CHRO|nr:hypothetical protein VL20_282 [Microcystis panniformis FACHB-1757]